MIGTKKITWPIDWQEVLVDRQVKSNPDIKMCTLPVSKTPGQYAMSELFWPWEW